LGYFLDTTAGIVMCTRALSEVTILHRQLLSVAGGLLLFDFYKCWGVLETGSDGTVSMNGTLSMAPC
jgi:hypothetical protein